jgi:DNA-binding NarL/FixJ family response regulator
VAVAAAAGDTGAHRSGERPEQPEPLEVVDELVAAGLAQVVTAPTGRVLAFPHGLVHASVADDLSPSRRAALHAAAAEVTTGDEALRHRLAAAHGPEPELVGAARRAAADHLAAGSRTAAARLLRAAAPRAASAADSQHLMAIAAGHLVVAGQPLGTPASALADLADLPDCAHRSFVLGRLALGRGALAEAHRLLARAGDQLAAEPEAAELAGPVSDMLAILALHEWRLDDLIALTRRSLADATESTMSATLLCHGLALRARFGDVEREMSDLLVDGKPPHLALDVRLGRGIARLWSNDLDGAERDLGEAAALVSERGTFLTEANVRSYRAELAYRAGRWTEALDLAEATASLVDDADEAWLRSLPHGVAAFVLAAQGRREPARLHVEAAWAGATTSPLMPARVWAAQAGFRLAAAGGDHAEVVAAGDRIVAEGWDAVPEGVHHWRATYVESLASVGRLDDALAAAEALAGAAAQVPGDVSVAADLARARAVVASAQGDPLAADEAFAAGLALDPDLTRPFGRALLELAAGAHQRRTGRRRAAADLLAQASDRLDALGAVPWYDRAAREIERCGLNPKRRSEAHEPELTAQERLVAHLVAGGRTNREVASELIISVKTVEHHLSRVYTKLGLRSRTELAARLS